MIPANSSANNLANMSLQHALKEWAIAVEALTQGETIVLMRKGGIRERDFQVKHSPIWLYPTYEHQKPHLLKAQYESAVTPVESGWHPEQVIIRSCAEITDVLPVDNINQLKALQPYHIWNEQMVGDRLKWKPSMPINVLLLRVYRLPLPQTIDYSPNYGGCKSWLDLTESISTVDLTPVITDDLYNQLVQEIKSLL